MTIHDFDMARFLLGEEPVSVTATAPCSSTRRSAKPATMTASRSSCRRLRQAGDHLELAPRHLWLRQRIEVHGSKGAVAAENQRPRFDRDRDRRRLHAPAAARFLHDALHGSLRQRDRKLHRRNRKGAEIAPSGKDGLAALALADAAVRSVEEKRQISIA